MTRGRRSGALSFLRRTGLTVVVVTGCGFACLGAVLVPRSILGAALVGALAGLIGFALVVGRTETPEEPQRHRHAIHVAVVSGGAVALTVLALTGMGTVLGAATAPVLLFCAIAAAPWTWTRFFPPVAPGPVGGVPDTMSPTVPRPRTVESGRVVDEHAEGPALESLSTLGLCGEWQRSYFALTDTTGPAERERIVAQRRRYLDELEGRDPDAVARWLATDARPAGSSPARHLSPSPRPDRRAAESRPPAGTDPFPGVNS